MSNRSIVDRVLLFAAAVCTAGLVWQLTVLMTAKGSTPSSRKIDVVSTIPVQPVQSAPAPATASTVRVVYPDGAAAKMTGKAIDTPEGTPVALASPSVINSASAPSTPPAVAAKPAPLAVAATNPAPPAVAPTPAAVGGAAPAPAASTPTAVVDAAPAPAAPTPAPASVPTSAAPAATPDPTVDNASATRSVDEASNEIASTVPATPPEAAASPRPRKTAAFAPAASAVSSSVRPVSGEAKPSSKRGGLNINRASIEALNHMPGAGRIGQAIADHRPYRSIEDLLAKRVVRRSVYEQIKHQLATE